MVTQEFFLPDSLASEQIATTKGTSDCELAAQAAGQRRIASSTCSVEESTPVCVSSVWASSPVRHSDGSCSVFIRICYKYSAKWWKKYVENNEHEAVKIAIGTGASFRFSVAREWSIFPPYSPDEDISEGYIVDSITVENGSGIDTVMVGDSWENIVWDSVNMPELGCGDLPESTGPVYVWGVGRTCTDCYIWVRGLEEEDPYNLGNTIVIRDLQGREQYRANYKKDGGDEVKITIPCNNMTRIVRAGGLIDVYDVWRKTWVRNVPLPSFANIEPYQKSLHAPTIKVRRNPLPGKPCNYEITIESEYVDTEWHKAYLFRGGLSEAEHEDAENLFKTKRYSLWGVDGAPLELIHFDDFNADRSVIRYNVEGPGTFTVAVEVGTCVFSLPVELPRCDIPIDDWGRLPIGRLPDSIKNLEDDRDKKWPDGSSQSGTNASRIGTASASNTNVKTSGDSLAHFELKRILL